MEHNKFILLIDDDSDDCELFQEASEVVDSSIKCNTINSVAKALDFLKKTRTLPDFIFLDMNMPVMNGKECLRLLKSDKRLKNIPVIIYSTSVVNQDLKELGAEFFEQKPVIFDDICEMIRRFIDVPVA